MDLSEGACASCGRELGPRSEWHVIADGRAFHNGCEPAPPPADPPPPNVPSLTEFAERKARDAIHGRGQKTLEEDDDA